ncbi:hypothetical protein H101_04712 [Trichophyton interdigitale H6]|nr:hypothetical protein H101_04712 [Trichophyton interdigitale H6]
MATLKTQHDMYCATTESGGARVAISVYNPSLLRCRVITGENQSSIAGKDPLHYQIHGQDCALCLLKMVEAVGSRKLAINPRWWMLGRGEPSPTGRNSGDTEEPAACFLSKFTSAYRTPPVLRTR